MDQEALISGKAQRYLVSRMRMRRWFVEWIFICILGSCLTALIFMAITLNSESGMSSPASPQWNRFQSGLHSLWRGQGDSSTNESSNLDEDDPNEPHSFRGFYGDKYAWFDDTQVGNFEPTDPPIEGRPGDLGKAVTDVDPVKVAIAMREHSQNEAASELIPMDRSIGDTRHPECKNWNYNEDQLPSASVIIVFHNEGFYTLMRTVHSVLIRSPQKYLKEVILIDDFSDQEPLKQHLDDYILDTFGPFNGAFDLNSYSRDEGMKGERVGMKTGKVRISRNIERMGLINARTRGATLATGDVIIFLDAHCECNLNWLTPLLAPIARNPKVMTVPLIDGINHDDYHYETIYDMKKHTKGIWDWGLLYKEFPLDMDHHLKNHRIGEPYRSPTHAGGLFAIGKDYFFSLGGYDSGLLVWGGEQFELSFKVWQCGGSLLWVPCSRVGHVYRSRMPYNMGGLEKKRSGGLIATNMRRVIDVWWDPMYREYYFIREPTHRHLDPGNLETQLMIKEQMGCQSFDWFIQHVAPDIYIDFPPPPPNVHVGSIISIMNHRCFDMGFSGDQIVMYPCNDSPSSQLFSLNTKGRLSVGERCLLFNRDLDKVTLSFCEKKRVDGPWIFDEPTGHFIIDGKCLRPDDKNDHLFHLIECDEDDGNQMFQWKEYEPRNMTTEL